MFESFTLSMTIAGNCDRIVGSPSEGVCGINGSDGSVLFGDSVTTNCTFDWKSLYGDQYDSFCYHVFDNNTPQLFNS